MTLRTSISAALERNRARKLKSKVLKARVEAEATQLAARFDRAESLTPAEIAVWIGSPEEIMDPLVRMWARRVAVQDASSLARDIAKCSEQDRRLLALSADGWTRREIAHYLFIPLTSVSQEVRRVFQQLGAKLVNP